MKPLSWLGTTIGNRYQIDTLLGQGGMSAVYKATDPNLRRPVAVKMIHAHLSNDPNFIGRFKEEAAAVARLRHPNIVQVHDFNIDGETYYMVMEYLVGETLQTRLKRLNATHRVMPLDEAVNLCIQLCEAAGFAHKHELVHRDIKPANIMLNVHGQAILMDFGIVKIIGGDYHTATGATIGTAMYMSPEQIRSERTDDRSDIYSLGVTLYEMLSGQPPYTADSALTLMMMVINDPLPDLHEAREGVPETLLTVVQKALAKDPIERFQSMTEMANALQQVKEELVTTPTSPAVTLVDESEIMAAPPVFVTESHPDQVNAQALQGVQPEAISPPGSLQKPAIKISSEATLQDVPIDTIHPLDIPAAPRSSPVSKKVNRRILLPGIGLLVLVILVASVLIFMNFRKPPGIQLMPISHPPEPVNAQTAKKVVNLGKWVTDSFIEAIVYSPDGSMLGTTNNRDWMIFSPYRFYNSLWQVQTGSLDYYLLGQTQWVYDAAFSPDGNLFGSVSDDGSLFLWQAADGNLERKIIYANGGLTSLDFSPDSLLLATTSWDGVVSLWQISNGNLLRKLQADDFTLNDVEFSPDGKFLATASENNSILLWQVSDGSLYHTLQDHTAPVHKAVFSPDGSLLASASEDSTLKIWQVSDGSLLQSVSAHTEAVNDVDFSPDGSVLASGSEDGVLRLWRVSDGELLNTLVEYSDGIRGVDFSSDGYLLVSGAADGMVHFWGISEAIQ
jgi:serine/threonine protein kinase